MATSQLMKKSRFTWGDTVKIVIHAPIQYRPGNFGSVSGIRLKDVSTEALEQTGVEEVFLYLIEFGDGHTVEIPGQFLEIG